MFPNNRYHLATLDLGDLGFGLCRELCFWTIAVLNRQSSRSGRSYRSARQSSSFSRRHAVAIMRLLPISLLFALCGAAMASTLEKRAEEKVSDSDAVKPTVFNGVEVPPLTQIEGQNFNTTVKDGWWIVKHHSYVLESKPKSIVLNTI